MDTKINDAYINRKSTLDANQEKSLLKEREEQSLRKDQSCKALCGSRLLSPSRLIPLGDMAISVFVMFPAVCLYWRGAWDLLSSLVFPGQEPRCSWTCSAVGALTTIDYFLLPALHGRITRDRKFLYLVFTRLFMMYHGILYMFLWRGVWGLADHYVTRNWLWSLVALAPTLGLMTLLRILRQTMWPPFIVAVDRGDLMTVANRFKSKPQNVGRYILDTIFTALLANLLAIFAWRTIWCVWDGLVYPNVSWWSDMTSFTAGLVGTLVLHALQKVFASVSMRLESGDYFLYRLMWEGFVYVIVFITMSSLWRGGWNLNIRYLISDPLLGGMVNHACGTALLLICNVYSLVGGCGCALDGAEKDGGAFFPVQYISMFCMKQDEVIDEKTRTVTVESYIPCGSKDGVEAARSHHTYDKFAEEVETHVKRKTRIRHRSYEKSGHITTGETEYLQLSEKVSRMVEHTEKDPHDTTQYATLHGHSEHGKYSEKQLQTRAPCEGELDNAVQENPAEPDS